ncbi:response regulator receiver modulated diguanylate cyclase/phosphodiesterase [[Leptolyngbya] sp. PCC 7376]|uniref:putative bifunctional diguanylate cyclase/phosphodiesterase n=1 Tax=[Leptolyngbya] sp. PCC 7376 TaxID=111781 RepID=UPI00029F3D11|nr:EAL domain-containing response regulator [[Leptolyngbya] sp. PCC 7376]AFY40351.1 response regulator receiver modulated diguanylate cyclase/phosphodiesterase [[Leptolyngbya] sp. PCC 7376]
MDQKLQRARILVVDDEVDLKHLIAQRFRAQIRANELEFLYAHNGEEALEILEGDADIDLVLTDLNMPKMDGLTLLKYLSKRDETLKSIVISAYGDMPNIRTAMNEGAFDFITKPIDFQDLAITIDKTIESVQRLREQKDQLQEALKKLEIQAFYDELTGLPNQNHLIGRIRQCMEWWKQRQSPFAIVYIHLDAFKLVKYGLGHHFSDQLAKEVTNLLRNLVGDSDTIARINFDEFAILLHDFEELEKVEQKSIEIYDTLSQPIIINDSQISSKVYIGVVSNSTCTGQPTDFLRAADTAMHEAKRADDLIGNKAIQFFHTSMQAGVTHRLELETELRKALGTEQLQLNYQPIVNLTTGKVSGFEALVRWQHPVKGWISPIDFIPMSEETKLIIPLGKWVLQEACCQFAQWQKSYTELEFISVNLSGVQLWNDDITNLIKQTLAQTKLAPGALKLEITETVLIQRGAKTGAEYLEQLRNLGVLLSIDDFGMGYSSLAYLKAFPINTLKIDKSFVDEIEKQDKDFEIAQTIVALAHALNLDVIAEGVEYDEQARILKALNCAYAQGYLFAKPLTTEEVNLLLEKSLRQSE